MIRGEPIKNKIFNACDKIASQRQNVTIRAVRECIGHGSQTTLSKYIKLWRSHEASDGLIQKKDVNIRAGAKNGSDRLNCASDFEEFETLDLFDEKQSRIKQPLTKKERKQRKKKRKLARKRK